MAKKSMRRFEISDSDWEKTEALLPAHAGYSGPKANNRLFINAVLHVACTGIAWRDLPTRFGKWNSVYVRFRRWALAGVWQKVFSGISDKELKTLMIDSTIVRVHQHGAGASKKAVVSKSKRSDAAEAV